MSDGPISAARSWRRQLRTPSWVSWALVVDWVVLIAIAVADFRVAAWPPHRQAVEPWLHDPSLTYPIARPETVIVPVLWLLTFRIPLAIVFAIGLVRLSLHEVHHGILAFLLAFESNDLATSFVKSYVGRLRPDFLARCQYDEIARACTGTLELVDEGRRSFPSGHSSAAFCGGVFIFLFLAGRSRAFSGHASDQTNVFQSKVLRATIAVCPLFMSAYIAISRFEDHRHHPTDIIAGSLLGTIFATAGYLLFFPSPFSSANYEIMAEPRALYGSERPVIALPVHDDLEAALADPAAALDRAAARTSDVRR